MKRSCLKSILLAVLIIAGTPIFAQEYVIDPGHTAVMSKAVRLGAAKVVGRFNDVSGSLVFNPATPAATTAEILIKADSYSANNTNGENAVKGDGFLNVKAFPEIKASIKGLMKTERGYVAKTNLTLHGVTKEVMVAVVITGPVLDLPTQKQSIGISGSVIINRQDFGITFSRKGPNNIEIVGNEVEIMIEALAVAR